MCLKKFNFTYLKRCGFWTHLSKSHDVLNVQVIFKIFSQTSSSIMIRKANEMWQLYIPRSRWWLQRTILALQKFRGSIVLQHSEATFYVTSLRSFVSLRTIVEYVQLQLPKIKKSRACQKLAKYIIIKTLSVWSSIKYSNIVTNFVPPSCLNTFQAFQSSDP